jgi:hypothetical protein
MKRILLLPILCSLGFFACKPELLVTPSEPRKDLAGSWQIIKATRNGTDLTTRFNFAPFRIHFTDSTYTIDSLVPFIVNRSGKWSFDDPSYPFTLSFQATDSSAKTSPLQFPVTGGQRNLIITFSPGCALNTYQYTLQKAN